MPRNEGELVGYGKALNSAVPQIKHDILIALKKQRETAECIEKLENHSAFLEKLMAEKEEHHPGFFASHPELDTSLKKELAGVSKLINYLKGDEKVRFSKEEMLALNQKSFVKKTLFMLLNKRLEELPMQDEQRPLSP